MTRPSRRCDPLTLWHSASEVCLPARKECRTLVPRMSKERCYHNLGDQEINKETVDEKGNSPWVANSRPANKIVYDVYGTKISLFRSQHPATGPVLTNMNWVHNLMFSKISMLVIKWLLCLLSQRTAHHNLGGNSPFIYKRKKRQILQAIGCGLYKCALVCLPVHSFIIKANK